MSESSTVPVGLAARGREFARAHAQFLRYASVGVGTTALDLVLFSVFALVVGLNPLLANVISTCITVCVSYLINRMFVFRSQAGAARTFVPFVTVTLFSGLVVQSLVIAGVVAAGTASIDEVFLKPGAKVVAMAVGMVSNYLGYRWLFGRHAHDGAEPGEQAAQLGPEPATPERREHRALAVIGGVLGAMAVFIRPPGTGPGQTIGTISVGTLAVAAAFIVAGFWALGRVRRQVWSWAAALGLVFAACCVLGDWFGGPQPRSWSSLSTARQVGVPLRAIGLTWVFAAVSAVLIEQALRGKQAPVRDGSGVGGRLVAWVRRGGFAPTAMLFALLVAARIPAWVIWWPGVVPFDTFRSYSMVRGTSPWDAYEPVGHTVLVWSYNQIGDALGFGDTGKVALAVGVQILMLAGAFTFMLIRMARWGVHRWVLWGSLAFLVFSPVFGLFSVIQVKDVPFAAVTVVFITAVGEVTVHAARSPRWPWVVMALAGCATLIARNNGLYVVVLTLLALLVCLRGMRRRALAVLVACVLGHLVWTGPVYSALDVKPGRAVEMYSIPIEQVGRIADEHAAQFTPSQRAWVARNFDGATPQFLAHKYDPGVSDPLKALAQESWDAHGSEEFLSGWSDLVRSYPGTASAATLAGTAGYWYPDAPLRDVFYTWSRNDIREVHLNIPSGPPTEGWRKTAIDASLLNTDADDTRRGMTTEEGFMGPPARTVPVLGMALSPGLMAWIWVGAAVAALLLGRRRRLAVTVPAAVLFLTIAASPVSGSIRYSMVLFAALPLALGMIATPLRPVEEAAGVGRRESPGSAESADGGDGVEVTASPTPGAAGPA
ncbi:DUF6020 family protein [Dermacoccaceae bacterium W4C1]